MNMRLGVCSWSLRPDGPSDLAQRVRAAGLDAVQLALNPLCDGAWLVDETRDALAAAGVRMLSGMLAMHGEDYSTLESIRRTGGVVPDEQWPANLELVRTGAAVAAGLRVPLVTFHAGFIPEERSDPQRRVVIERLRTIADVCAEHGLAVGLETGQESAETLESLLLELDREWVGVNFDPANMILYGMGDPVTALRRLLPFVRQVHVKDALPTGKPGTWGREVAAGSGAVDWPAFFDALGDGGECDLVIEREAGEQRVEDVRTARGLVLREAQRAGLTLRPASPGGR